MVQSTPANDVLTGLLRKFADPGGNGRVAQAAHRAFYNSLHKTLDRQALQSTNYNQELARVAVQEAWIKILRSAHRYDPALASVETWAKMITRQCANDLLRSAYVTEKIFEPAEEPEAFACPLPQSDELLYQQQVEQATAQCIATLPSGRGPNYRLALELALDPDLSYADMTSRLQEQVQGGALLNAEQVRGWVRQALKRMRECINRKLDLRPQGMAT
ncbi:RNA polymerase sigma factor [Massilia sp. DWR3-1-1]|uniref:RNA polymerase sigma factor n=1 Tax=Massilia sp. DWR3-1-1 TaxID=2804559 RepID=UPI003CEBE37E